MMKRKTQKDFSSNIHLQKVLNSRVETDTALRVQVGMILNDPEPLEIWLSIMSLFSESLNGRIKHLSPVQQRENLVAFEKKKWLF